MTANVTDGPRELAGMELRPFTLGTLELCQQLGLTLFSGGGVPEGAAERLRQVAAYLFIQSEPLEDVLHAVDSPDFDQVHLRPFKFRLTPGVVDAAWALIEENLSKAGAAVVEIAPRPGSDKGESPPPNS